jgi:hypothetical protein
MLNPALLAVVIATAAIEYERAEGGAMPWPLAFLVAPLVLHRGTRQVLPRTTRTHLAAWVSGHPVEHAGFAPRAQALTGSVREGLRFGLTHGALRVDERGRVSGVLARRAPSKGSEVADIVAKSGFVGKWLAKVEQPATAFVLLGVAP